MYDNCHNDMVFKVILALGSNVAGPWGESVAALRRAVATIAIDVGQLGNVSPLYASLPASHIRQPNFLNLALTLEETPPPATLLRLVKAMERQAGRQVVGPRNGPRPLDIDILAYDGMVVNWPSGVGSRRPTLVLPHPLLQARGFVLKPLVDVAPHWVHPVYRLSAADLLRRNSGVVRGTWQRLDRGWHLCE